MLLVVKSYRTTGHLAYEYHPFRNLVRNVNVKKTTNGFYILEGLVIDGTTGEVLTYKNDNYVNKNGIIIPSSNIVTYETLNSDVIESKSLSEMDTNKLNFDLNHPVDIEVLPSYDGSVNLILNDDKNIPRIINSRFSVRENNTYEIVDRIGENDSNIYNEDRFNSDSSLYLQYHLNPVIKFSKVIAGKLPVGLYCFYITYCDSDENESNFVAESPLIPLFIGDIDNLDAGVNDYGNLADGGIKNLSSLKGIELNISNYDQDYKYIKIYYVRFFADHSLNRVFEAKKIIKKYSIILNNKKEYILLITGIEETEDIDPNTLNFSKVNITSAKTLALCKNMFFLANINKFLDNYRELLDLSLRIVPDILEYNLNHITSYNSIVNKVPYYPGELYRFGVVYIYNNGTYSNVYNVCGRMLGLGLHYNGVNLSNNDDTYLYEELTEGLKKRRYIETSEDGNIQNASEFYSGDFTYINAKGVCKFSEIYSKYQTIKFTVPNDIKTILKKLNIRGMFFVRQKRIPLIISQLMLLPMEEFLQAPVYIKKEQNSGLIYGVESFITKDDKLVSDSNEEKYKRRFETRSAKSDNDDYPFSVCNYDYCGVCPDFLFNLPYYNQIFNGNKFTLKEAAKLLETYLGKEKEFIDYFHTTEGIDGINTTAQICSVTEDVQTVTLGKQIFRLKIGDCETAYSARTFGKDVGDYEDNLENEWNVVRGIYSPYLAIHVEDSKSLKIGSIYNVYKENDLDLEQQFKSRYYNKDPYYSISDIVSLDNLGILVCYKGDCFYNRFTYRLNRNFNDPSLPNNDTIIKKDTWEENIGENRKDIIRSDINAVKLGTWLTFNIFSHFNYLLRSEDHSHVSEKAMMGSPRTYYPKVSSPSLGTYKMSDSYLYNDAYRNTLGYKCYFTLEDFNYLKNTFSNRILYSSIAIRDSFKNNYRDSLTVYYRDYSQEYGSILKLVGFEGHLLVIFEHGIGVAVINERVLAGGGDGEPVFINTKNVLPEELTIISDTLGTLWPESVIKSESGYVYGLDTINKKIWRIKGLQLEILSDFKIESFLNNNITFGEKEKTPIIGLKNVKSHYNNNKKDIMFTFYDDIYGYEEKVWNICFNELLNQFVTFYSWIPSYSENIDTQYFSFDRNVSKEAALINLHSSNNDLAYGIVLDSTEFQISATISSGNSLTSLRMDFNLTYRRLEVPKQVEIFLDGYESTTNYPYKVDDSVKFLLEKDPYGNHKYMDIDENNGKTLWVKSEIFEMYPNRNKFYVYITPYIEYDDGDENSENNLKTYFKTEKILLVKKYYLNKENYFYLHGKSGIIDSQTPLLPCYWYDKLHPFEFEFIINDKIEYQKIFTNLIIISNKAEPLSFHFEIEGDNYEFSADKRTMYFRLEATKELYLNLGSEIHFDRDYKDVIKECYTKELYYRGDDSENKYTNLYGKFDKVYPIYNLGLVQQVKSTIFPLYYEKVDEYDNLYYLYLLMEGNGYDFKNLSGSEIRWNKRANQFNIITHIKNSPINLVGRLRGNSLYKEGKWNIQIPSIIFNLKNERPWNTLPPIVINSNNTPSDLTGGNISEDNIPNIYRPFLSNGTTIYEYIDLNGDWTHRKETLIRDKWIKVRVRYSGENLAIIHSLVTLYNISYS